MVTSFLPTVGRPLTRWYNWLDWVKFWTLFQIQSNLNGVQTSHRVQLPLRSLETVLSRRPRVVLNFRNLSYQVPYLSWFTCQCIETLEHVFFRAQTLQFDIGRIREGTALRASHRHLFQVFKIQTSILNDEEQCKKGMLNSDRRDTLARLMLISPRAPRDI